MRPYGARYWREGKKSALDRATPISETVLYLPSVGANKPPSKIGNSRTLNTVVRRQAWAASARFTVESPCLTVASRP